MTAAARRGSARQADAHTGNRTTATGFTLLNAGPLPLPLPLLSNLCLKNMNLSPGLKRYICLNFPCQIWREYINRNAVELRAHNLTGSCHKRQKAQAPIRKRQTRKVANAKVLNRKTNLT